MTTDGLVAGGYAALDEGRWADARAAFEASDRERETAEGCFGLAVALWWLGENLECVGRCTRAYALYRRGDDAAGAARCAVWLAITYKSNFGNFAAANPKHPSAVSRSRSAASKAARASAHRPSSRAA